MLLSAVAPPKRLGKSEPNSATSVQPCVISEAPHAASRQYVVGEKAGGAGGAVAPAEVVAAVRGEVEGVGALVGGRWQMIIGS